MSLWKKWDGKTDLKKCVLVKTENNKVMTAEQLTDPMVWTIYNPWKPPLYRPRLEEKVIEYIDLKTL